MFNSFDGFNDFITGNTPLFSLIGAVCIFIILTGYFFLTYKQLNNKKSFNIILISSIITIVSNLSIFLNSDNLRYFEIIGFNLTSIMAFVGIIIAVVIFVIFYIIYKKAQKEKPQDKESDSNCKNVKKDKIKLFVCISLCWFLLSTVITYILNLICL